jgi:hypothetical protein
MYERDVDVPHLRARYSADQACRPCCVEPSIRCARGNPFNSIGLKLYRDQHAMCLRQEYP